uniref:Zinc finger PHD-type domain-containing protein n=1 Tax=Rhizophora mucronata TaxID=61149 RepID=A0A2P2M0K8_RHIMU
MIADHTKVPLQAEKKFGKRSMRRKCHTGAESGTCNVCSAPCSSCMHRNLTCGGPKGDECSDETGRVTVTSDCSVNERGVLLPFKDVTCDSLQHTTSEASNMLSPNSSHDSLSENAESKVKIRPSDMVDTSMESELPKLFSGDTTDERLSSKSHCLLNHNACSNKLEDSESVRAHDDNMQCIGGGNDAGITVKCCNKNVDKKSVLCSSALVSCLESEGFEKALLADNSDTSESPSDNVDAGNSAPKVQRKFPSSNRNDTNQEGPSFQVKQENISEHANLSLLKGAGDDAGHGDGLPAHYIVDNYGESVSKVSSRVYLKLEPETNRNGGDQGVEDFKCSGKAGQDEKLNDELPGMQKSLQSLSGDESDESEIMEHDVKVCDICGDAGREDLLAVCSRCSDGAEHTYCMREMLQKVPEGDWLCEECKLAEEIENQKQGSDDEEKMVEKADRRIAGKRHAENIELDSALKRQAIETSLGSPKPSGPSKIVSLSRDSSFKNLDRGKVKPAHEASFGNRPSIDIPDIACSSSLNPRLQTPKGTLLKSNSFNTLISKSKVRVVDEVRQKCKGAGEITSLDVKEDPAKMMTKSVSFKSINSGCSNATESKIKMLSAKLSHVQDVKGLKQMKDRNAFERKNLSKLDRPPGSLATTNSNVFTPKVDQKLTPRSENSLAFSASKNRELKTVHSDPKLGALSRSFSNIGRKAAEIPVTSVRTSSTNGMSGISAEQKLSKVSPKDELSSSSSWTAERPSNNATENLQDGLPQSRESSNQGNKMRDGAVSILRPTVTSGQKSITCKRCKEIGHAAEYCTIISSQDSDANVFTTKSVKEGNSKSSKLKAAIEAAMLKKPGIYRKRKETDQSDILFSSNMDVSVEIASSDQASVSTQLKDRVSDRQSHEGEANLGADLSASYKLKNPNTVKQLNSQSTDVVLPCKTGTLESIISSVGMQSQALAGTHVFQKISAIPDHEYIWQGAFDVCRGGKPLETYGGIQAHLSTCASPKVLEVVNKFPHKITFDEVPRLSTWPQLFHDNGAKEDNIALYLFAKDFGSYESYKGLLDNMIKKDLALRGSFDGVELLIFPSTQLPQNSQRWNMLFFLWGVFRARRSNCSDSTKNVMPSWNAPAAASSLSENLCFGEIPMYDSSCDAAVASVAPDKLIMPLPVNPDKKISGLQTNSEKQESRFGSKSLSNFAASNASLCPENRCTSFSQKADTQECRVHAEVKPSTSTAGTSSSFNGATKTQLHVHGDVSHARVSTSGSKVSHVGNEILCDGGTSGTEEMVDVEDSHRDEVKIVMDLNANVNIESPLERDQTLKGINGWQPNNRKRPYLDPLESGTQTSGSSSQTTAEVDGTFADDEVYGKKPKTDSSGQYGCSNMRVKFPLGDTFAPQLATLGSSSLVERSRGKASVDKVNSEGIGTTEKSFFPVDSNCAKDFWVGNKSMAWKEPSSKDEDCSHDGAPNLELALGAETKSSSRGNLPFFVRMVEKNHDWNKPLDKVAEEVEEDGVSASLSLSLSFPFPDKEQTAKPVSKTELLPERHRVNTSLLL